MSLDRRDPFTTRAGFVGQAGVARPTVTTWVKRQGQETAHYREGARDRADGLACGSWVKVASMHTLRGLLRLRRCVAEASAVRELKHAGG